MSKVDSIRHDVTLPRNLPEPQLRYAVLCSVVLTSLEMLSHVAWGGVSVTQAWRGFSLDAGCDCGGWDGVLLCCLVVDETVF